MAKLYFRYGAIGSGKSTALLQIAHNYNDKKMQVLLIKPKLDETSGIFVESKMGLIRQVDYVFPPKIKIRSKLILDDIKAIVIDNAHLLSAHQIDEFFEITKEENIPVFCYGLRTDFQMKGFAGSTRLLELADDIEELKSVCKCGEKATQNIRYYNGVPTFTGDQIMHPDELITYEGVCGKCFLKIKKEEKR